MLKPAIPANEKQRLAALRSLELLDTAPEERFDRVTRLAKQVFGAPIALVSLVDSDRQWFKSRQGLDATETPRDISFCGHAILDDRIMVVNDATSDQRFCDNPLVCGDPNIRFYAGYPLSAVDGSRVGTLCVIDKKPRSVKEEQLVLLRELGRMVEEELIAASAATVDPGTGLSSRAGYSMIADYVLPLCARGGNPASLLLLHLSNLHRIEESLGYEEGEAVAVEFAHLLLTAFRGSDIVARISADLFAVLVGNADIHQTEAPWSRFERILGERNRNAPGETRIELDHVTVGYCPDRHENAMKFLEDAENLMAEQQAAA